MNNFNKIKAIERDNSAGKASRQSNQEDYDHYAAARSNSGERRVADQLIIKSKGSRNQEKMNGGSLPQKILRSRDQSVSKRDASVNKKTGRVLLQSPTLVNLNAVSDGEVDDEQP